MSEDVHIEPSGRGTRYPPPRKVHYPGSNGLPIAETRFQYDSLTYAAGALDIYFRDRPGCRGGRVSGCSTTSKGSPVPESPRTCSW